MNARGAALGLGVWLVMQLTAHAQSNDILLEADASLGAPARSRPVRLEPAPEGEGLQLKVGAKRMPLDWAGVTRASHQVLPVEGGGAVLLVKGENEEAHYQALVGGTQANVLLWQGRVDLLGDPGERRAQGVHVEGTETAAQVQVGTRLEAARRCDGSPVLLDVRRLDAKSLRLRSLRNEPGGSEAAAQVKGQALEALHDPSALGALRVVAVSDGDPDAPVRPAPELTDGDPASAWQPSGKGPWLVRATLATAGFEVTAVELEAPPAPARLPSELWLELGKGAPLHVQLDPAARRQVVTLPAPVEASCLSVLVPAPQKRQGLAELRAITALDEGDPATRLAEALVTGGKPAAQAPRLLSRMGAPGAKATLAVWPRLDVAGRRRALRVLGPWLGEPQVLAAVTEAAAQPALAEEAVQALATSEAGRGALATLAAQPDETGRRAVTALGNAPHAAPALLALLDAPGGADRPALRDAVAAQAAQAPSEMAQAADVWLLDASPEARASFALATAGSDPALVPSVEAACLAPAEPPAPAARQAAETDPAPAQTRAFPERYRCALALAQLPAKPSSDEWLAAETRGAEEWMQREAALEALAKRESPLAATAAHRSLGDPYPRVRAEAAHALPVGDGAEVLMTLAAEDAWPMVRAAAVRALRQDPQALPVLRKRIQDGAREVRTAAIEAVTLQRDAQAWPGVEKRLMHPHEVASVRAAGVRYAASLCLAQAQPALLAQLDRSMAEGATQPDAAVAIEALRALRALGGDARAQADAWIAESGAPDALSQSAGEPAACSATTPPDDATM